MLQASVVSVDDSDSCLGHVEYLKAGEALLEMPKNPPPPSGSSQQTVDLVTPSPSTHGTINLSSDPEETQPVNPPPFFNTPNRINVLIQYHIHLKYCKLKKTGCILVGSGVCIWSGRFVLPVRQVSRW